PADAQPLLRQGSAGSKPLTRLQPDCNPTARNPTPGVVGYPVPGLSGTGVSGSRVGLAPRPPDPTRAKHYLCDDDLSKVILQSEPSYCAFSPMYKKYFNQGMQLMCLDLYKPDSFDEQFGSMVFSGLKKIQMHMGIIPVSFSFLNHYFARHTPPFLSSFIQESRSQQQDLTKLFIVRKVGLHRAIGLSSQEWSIMGLTLDTTFASTSLIEILTLTASSFPKLENLTLNLDDHKATYDVHEFGTAFKQFSSLKTVSLHRAFKILNFGSDELLPPVRQLNPRVALDTLVAHVETGTLWYSSWIAKVTKSLEAIYIEDKDYEDQTSFVGNYWQLVGWFHVVNGIRDIRGVLERSASETCLDSEVSLDTQMLPHLIAITIRG
ncbi:hypothetical protein F5880DRAFT_1512232, partial [Lentinula raphanica]